MKKALLIICVFVLVAYGIIAILLTDFSGNKLGPSDGEIVLQYIITNANDEVVDRVSQNVPVWTRDDGEMETKNKQTKMLAAADFEEAMAGYSFKGWYIGGKKYNSGDWVPAGLTDMVVEVRSDWRPRILTVTYDARLGSQPGRMSVFYGMTYGEAANQISRRPGYKLSGWWTLPDKQGTLITANTAVTETDNMTLYAAWEADSSVEVSESFTINFDLNGSAASGLVSIPGIPSAVQNVNPEVQNLNVNLPSAVSTNANDTFAGWFETGRLNGTQILTYKNAQSLVTSTSKTVSLTAKWSTSGETVTPPPPSGVSLRIDFDLGGLGQNNEEGVSITVGGNNVIFNIPSSNNSQYTFERWTYLGKTVASSNDVIAAGAAGTALVVAEWKYTAPAVATFTVTFDVNTGTHNPNGSNITVSATNYIFRTPTKTGSVFYGWHWNNQKFTDAFSLKNSAGGTGATVVAKWDNAAVTPPPPPSPTTWTVTLRNNVNGTIKTVANASGWTSINTPSSYFGTLSGTFKYWSVSSSSETYSSQSFSYNVTGNVTLTAYYEPASAAAPTYTITLRNTVNNQAYTLTKVSGFIPISSPTRYFTGLSGRFLYWMEGNVIVSYQESWDYRADANATVTAHYQPEVTVPVTPKYTVTLKNSVNGTSKTITNASGWTRINSPSSYFGTLSGTFQYWYVNSSSETYSSQSFSYYVTGNVTLTAYYSAPVAKTYTVTLRNNINSDVEYIYNALGSTRIYSPLTLFGVNDFNGYSFGNWRRSSTVVSSSEAFNYNVTGNVTLTAYFTAEALRIIFRSEVAFSTSHPSITTTNSTVTFTTNVRATNTAYTFLRWRLEDPDYGTVVTNTANTKTAAKNQGYYGTVYVWAEWRYTAPVVNYTYNITFKANGGVFPAGVYWGTRRSASTADYTRTGMSSIYYLNGEDLFSPVLSDALKLTHSNVGGRKVGRAGWHVIKYGILPNMAAFNNYKYYIVHTARNCGYSGCTECHGMNLKTLFQTWEVKYPSAVRTSGTVKTLTLYATWYYMS